MNIRCSFCQTPYTLSRFEMLDALQEMDAQKLSHYDAHCPRCRRATPVLRQKMEMAFPNWREALKELEVELAEHPQQAAAPAQPGAGSAAQTESQPEPVAAKSRSRGATRPKPEAKPVAGRPQAARSELGRKPPAKNTPAASKGKKKSK
jgi:hypothetical protein